MRRVHYAWLAAVAVIGFTSAASAADLPVKAPVYKAPSVVAPSWTGFYIGANAGGGWGNRSVGYAANDRASDFIFTVGGAPPATSFNTSGAIGGLQLGYNWQFNRVWLIGVETDFDWSGIKGSTPNNFTFLNGDPVSAQVDERLKWFGTVRGRLGFLPADNLLAYITGGFAYGRLERTGSLIDPNGMIAQIVPFGVDCTAGMPACFTGASSTAATGWTAGAGFEYRLWEHWSVKAEYLYVDLRGNSVTETATRFNPGITPNPATFNANYNRASFNIGRLGLNWHF
jgi:outer membrane immunogenic protein